MNEQEWLTCADPDRMLEFLQDKATERKLRLFACACRRRVDRWFADQRSRYFVEVTEDFVDGLTSEDWFKEASNDAYLAVWSPRQHANAGHRVCLWYAARAATDGGKKDAYHVAQFVSYAAAASFATTPLTWSDRRWDRFLLVAHTEAHGPLSNEGFWEEAVLSEAPFDLSWDAFKAFPGWAAERKNQADLLRHVFGNSSRPHHESPYWLTTAVLLADALYHGENCSFALHDVLLEAGYPDLAEHFCREQGHPKGCWAMDTILGKK